MRGVLHSSVIYMRGVLHLSVIYMREVLHSSVKYMRGVLHLSVIYMREVLHLSTYFPPVWTSKMLSFSKDWRDSFPLRQHHRKSVPLQQRSGLRLHTGPLHGSGEDPPGGGLHRHLSAPHPQQVRHVHRARQHPAELDWRVQQVVAPAPCIIIVIVDDDSRMWRRGG